MPMPSSGAISFSQMQTEFGGSNPISFSEYYKNGGLVGPSDGANIPTSGAISLSNFYGAAKIIAGQVAYTTAGTYSWVVPAGVTSVCVVCVGGGAGSGGALAYGNAMSVTPGESISLQVGAAGTAFPGTTDAGDSWFRSSAVLNAGGGKPITHAGGVASGSSLSGGGQGGGTYSGGGGGGAGGYSGAGGGGTSNSSGADGAGGAGASGSSNTPASNGSGGGGGVGLLGQGASGLAAAVGTALSGAAGGGGSGGANGSVGGGGIGGPGGAYGGGAGAYGGSGSFGGVGAVRIIWGAGRAFPSTNTGNV